MLTFNQIIRRIRTVALAHQQVKTFGRGLVTDFLTDKTTNYPAVFLQNAGGRFSMTGRSSTINFRMFIVDMVHVSEESKENELDVHSDMISIGLDLLTQFNNPNYNDWRISSDNNFQLLVETDGDMYAGIYVDFSISFVYNQNVCEVPTTKTIYQTAD
jgi:hypothetical protein